MKKTYGYLLSFSFFIGLVLIFSILQTTPTKTAIKPLLQEEEEFEKDKFDKKNRKWSEQEYIDNENEFEKIRNSIQEAKTLLPRALNIYAGGNLSGAWISRGPDNMPGAFEFCEMDEGTDTVYAVTCGHYGGVQFIWKGTLTDDTWKMINPLNPSRFEDLIVIPNNNLRRVIAGHEKGKIMYSDDGGATWTYSTGITGGIHSTIINRQDNNKIYATDGKKVFLSTDRGTSFTVFQTIGTSAGFARLYSPRWSVQPNAIEVYLAVDSKFYKLGANQASFVQTGTLPTGGPIGIGGDTRKLWVTLDSRKWHASTNGGQTWAYVPTTNCWYTTLENDMYVGQYPGVHPEDPNILIGGYSNPLTTRDAGVTTNVDANQYWGYYQNSVGNDPKVRANYHPDLQASQFFYDKTGTLFNLRVSDGGLYITYNDWQKTSFPTYADMNGVYYNISFYGKPSQEAYRGGFFYGKNNLSHLTVGTQDQGWQNTRANTSTTQMYSWDQVQGGDGPCCITGDGVIGWEYNYFGDKDFRRIQLYNGTTYKGLSGTKTPVQNFTFTGGSYFTPSVGDWNNGNRIWVLSQTLRRIEYSTTTTQITALEKNLTNTNHYFQGLAQSKVTPSLVYTMQNGYVFKSTDTGTNWTQIANQSATGMSGVTENRGMGWSSPLDQQVVLFASESGTSVKSIFSKDGGVTWTNVTGTGPNLFPNAEVNGMAGTADGKMVFASTNKGPYVFVVSEEKWYPLATDVDSPIFWGQIVYCVKYGTQEVARFSTWGQGVWDFMIYSTATDVASENTEADHLNTFPNPASEFLNVSFTNLTGPSEIVIYSLTGEKVYHQAVGSNSAIRINVNGFSNGAYILSYKNGGYSERKRFIVSH